MTDVIDKYHAEAILRARGFEQIKSIPEGSDIFERFMVREYDKNTPRMVTRFELASEPDESGVIECAPITSVRNFMRRVESLWVMRSGFNVPEYTIYHNYLPGPAHYKMPISSSVHKNTEPGWHDTSLYCVVETIFLDDGGAQ